MSHELAYESNGHGVVVTMSGDAKGPDLHKAVRAMYGGDSEHKLRYQIVDFSRARDFDVAEDDLRRIAMLDQNAAIKSPNQVVALVGTDEFFKGANQRYAVYAQVWAGFETEFFTSVADARAWVASVCQEYAE